MKLRALVTAVVLLLAGQALTAPGGQAAEPRGFGVAMPGVPGDTAALAGLSSAIGRAPSSVMWYVAWSRRASFPSAGAAQVAATGAVPEITWEPWDPAAGTNQPRYSLASIAGGKHDSYIASWARAARSYGGPVVIRFAHEMNGNWYPWAAQVNGGSAASYVAAWRRVVSVFDRNGATNVQWSWSPNVPYEGSTSLASLYPGDDYVDRVALDGYNWGTTQSWSSWQSFEQVFAPGVAELQAITDRPIHIGETGSTEQGGDKAAWVRDMFAYLAAHPEIRGVTWFHFLKETDWRIDSSPGSLAAFQEGLRTYG